MKKALFIVTNANELAPGYPTGIWAEEFAVPYRSLSKAGVEVTVASPKGGAVPIDENSLKDFDQREWSQELAVLKDSVELGKINGDDYELVFFPGGHGPVIDLPDNDKVQQIISRFDEKKKTIGAVCHGLAALLNAKNQKGDFVISGRKVTGFSNAEEKAVGLDKVMPYLIEDRLVEVGAKYQKADQDFGAKVVVDGHIVTGQNPASSKLVGKELKAQLGMT